MRTSDHHRNLDANGEGKCSVPMWSGGGVPAGFCDRPAFGEPTPCGTYRDGDGKVRREDGKYAGYVPGLACTVHGGPERKATPTVDHLTEIDIVFDGPPSHEAGRFVEVERTADQHSMNVGEWVQRDDEYWVLRLRIPTEDIKACEEK